MTIKQRLWCVQVPKRSGEPVRSLLVGMGAFERDAAVQRDDDYLYFPVKYEIAISDQFPDVRLLQRDFECVEKQTFEDILGFTPSYDMIGDIAIIDADDPDAEGIADAILLMHRHIKTVLGALSPVQGRHSPDAQAHKDRSRSAVTGAGRVSGPGSPRGCGRAEDRDSA